MKTMYQKLLFLLLMLPFGALAQSNSVSGTVRDNTQGQPLPGVNVIVEGTQNGTSTDMDGNFTLNNVNVGSRLIFSYIGFANQSISFTGQSQLDVVLSEDATQLKEVVVIGYGTANKKDATGALTNITSEQFQKGPIVASEQLIQGRAAGVQVTTSGGAPGSGSTVRIRTGSSFISNDPLYVIDGVAVDVGGGGANGGRSALAAINPNDIASMTILKDAASLAIYGARASNGVVIITTKRGKTGEMKISYNGNFQVNTVAKTVDVLNADQYRNFINTYGNDTQKGLLGTANTDWQKQIYHTALGTDHSLALSGGSDNITYRTSVGYTNINGLLKTDNFERVTTSANVTGNFFDNHLKIDVNNKTSIQHNFYANTSAIGAAVAFDPTQPVHADNQWGNYFQWATGANYEVNASRNPVAFLEQTHNYGTSYRSIGNAQLEYKIHGFEELKLVSNFGYDHATGRSFGNTDSNYVVPAEAGSSYNSPNDNFNKVMDLYFNYNKYVEGIKTNFDVTGGYNYQDFRYSGQGTNYSAANNVTTFSNNYYKTRINLQSFFGRATFTIANKYILNGSFRADASSRVANNLWGYFPAGSVAYKINEENFLKDSKYISQLKVRASYGKTGQQDTGSAYPSLPLYQQSNSTAQYQMGYDANGNPVYYNTYRPSGYNANLKWETTGTANFGLDFGLFNDRITGSADYYTRKTTNLIQTAFNPQGVNFSNTASYNIGSLKNKGLELALDTYPVRNDNVTWRVGGNMTWQNSEISKLTTGYVPSFQGYNVGGISGGVGTTIQNNQVGYWPNAYYVYEQAYGADGKPLSGVYVDRNHDGVINTQDLYRFHKPQATVFYGFNTDFSYKSWFLSAQWRGSWGNYNYNNVFSNTGNRVTGLPSNGNYLNNIHSNALETNFVNPQYLSDYYVQNASFLRMDNVTLGYTFKNTFGEGSNMRLSGAVQNVFIITKYKGMDPEISGGIDNNFYPRPRTYTLGLNVNF